MLPKPSRGGKRGSAAAELPPDAEAEWSTECTTLEELQEFAKRMSASRNKVDKELGELIDDEVCVRDKRGARVPARVHCVWAGHWPGQRAGHRQHATRARYH